MSEVSETVKLIERLRKNAEYLDSLALGLADAAADALERLTSYRPQEGRDESAKITLRPGAADDPERDNCFRGMQLACAGARIGAALAAHIDSLAGVVVVGATDRANADSILESTARDLRQAVDDNWHTVRDQLAAASRETGTA